MNNAHYATYRWILAWLVMIVLLSYFNTTRIGHVIIYYALALSLLLVVATQYRFFTFALAPLGTPASPANPAGNDNNQVV